MQILSSFVDNADDSLFSLYNLPYGVFHCHDEPRIGVAIGDFVLDLGLLEKEGLLMIQGESAVFSEKSLNRFASLGSACWARVRARIQTLLSRHHFELQDKRTLVDEALILRNKVQMLAPFHIGGFTDFYASENHATHVGQLFRGGENPLLPNWKYLPVAYNGRASTVFVSGKGIPRPWGQIKCSPESPPIFSPSKKLDFELELGIFIGAGNPEGEPIALDKARSHIFGCVLLNDWSARDIQAFEYQPLGPFLSKSFATSISPWVVPMQALETAMQPLPAQDPKPVEYLYQRERFYPDIHLQVDLKPAGSTQRMRICTTSTKELYWTVEQMLAHHTVNHCILQSGDLLGSGTISGSNKENQGCLLERTLNGKEPLQLDDGKVRCFLEDGDTIILSGYCQSPQGKLGFGEVEGTILPARV